MLVNFDQNVTHWKWGHHRAHVHAGLVAIYFTLNDFMFFGFLVVLLTCDSFILIRHMRPQLWQQHGTFGH